jgi:hypothetical protein
MGNNSLQDKLTVLVGEFGKDKVTEIAEQLLSASVKKVPAGYSQVIHPENVQLAINSVDAAISDVVAAGQKVEAAYGKRASLMKEKTKLETAVKLKEAQAFMDIKGEGRSQYVIWNGEKVALTNDSLRDAYRRMVSKKEREELTNVQADLSEIEIQIQEAKEGWYTAKEGSDLVKAKAHVQAELLRFLA